MHLTYDFDFHPIGQGLFYSGKIVADQKTFSVVYDCGSFADIKHRERVIKSSGIDGPIDLLIISHFHQDHINGLKKLLEQSGGVKKVIMPYLHPAERVLNLFGPDGGYENEEYRRIIADPVLFFGGDNSDNRPDVDFIVPDAKSEIKSILEDKYPWWDGSRVKPPNEEYNGNEKVSYYGNASNLRAPYWLFRFYNEPSKVSLDKILEKFLKKGIKPEDIFKNLDSKIEDIKQIYNELFGKNQNETSLVCCHGPYINRRRNGYFFMSRSQYIAGTTTSFHESEHVDERFRISHDRANSRTIENIGAYQMLMGDARIKDKKAYLAHYCHEINDVVVFLIPHHGSKNNWNDWFVDEFRNCAFWPCSHGKPPNKKYHHPSADFSALNKKGISMVSITEDAMARFEGAIHA